MQSCQKKNLKRPACRHKASIQVYFGAQNEFTLSNFASKSVDLSSGGLFLETQQPMKIGEKLLLRFRLMASGRTITCNAKVAWINDKSNLSKQEYPPGLGIEFIDLSARDFNIINSHVLLSGP